MKKLKIHYTFYLFLITSLFYNLFGLILVMYCIIILHEIGHLIAIKVFKYDVHRITLLPFGAIIDCDMNKNKSIISEIIIYSSGLLMNVLIFIIVLIFRLPNTILYLNFAVILFNIIPMLPLDGGRILLSLLSCKFRYKASMKISYFTSMFISLMLIIGSVFYFNSMNFIFVLSYILITNIVLLLSINKQYEGFLLGKYLNANYYLKYKNIEIKEIGIENNFYKGKQNLLETKSKKYYEREVLKTKYKLD